MRGDAVIGDYENELAQRRYEPVTGTGSAIEVIPSDAWVSAFGLAAGLTDATLVITLANGTVYDTITVPAGTTGNEPRTYDSGKLAGASFAFSDTLAYSITLHRTP